MMNTTTARPSSATSSRLAGRLVLVAALAGTALLASGCASLHGAATTEVDSLYVAQVERAARQMGTTVVWINYPQRTRTAAEPAAR